MRKIISLLCVLAFLLLVLLCACGRVPRQGIRIEAVADTVNRPIYLARGTMQGSKKAWTFETWLNPDDMENYYLPFSEQHYLPDTLK